YALKKMGAEAKTAVPALIVALKDQEEDVRCVVADALGAIGPAAREAVPALAEGLKDKDSGPHCAHALALLGNEAKPAIPALAEAMQLPAIRPHAAQCLGRLGTLGLPTLQKALQETDDDTKIDAILGLGIIGKEAVPALLPMLREREPDV